MPNLRSSVYGWKSVWMDLADEVKGDFIEETNGAKVRVPMNPWTVTFETNTKGKPHSRILLPYDSKADFAFEIYNRNWIADAQKKFGLQDIIVGYEDFDRDFIIKGNEENKVKKLFSSEPLREMIQLQKAVRLSIHKNGALKAFGKVPAGVNILAFDEDDELNSFDRLVSLLELMRAIMSQLCELGVATNKDPNFQI
jgi:hypothetical protein